MNYLVGGLIGALVGSLIYGWRMRRAYLRTLDRWIAAIEHSQATNKELQEALAGMSEAQGDLEYVISGERTPRQDRPGC